MYSIGSRVWNTWDRIQWIRTLLKPGGYCFNKWGQSPRAFFGNCRQNGDIRRSSVLAVSLYFWCKEAQQIIKPPMPRYWKKEARQENCNPAWNWKAEMKMSVVQMPCSSIAEAQSNRSLAVQFRPSNSLHVQYLWICLLDFGVLGWAGGDWLNATKFSSRREGSQLVSLVGTLRYEFNTWQL